MKFICLPVFLLLSLLSFSQPAGKVKGEHTEKILMMDSARLARLNDSVIKAAREAQQKEWTEQNDRNLDRLVQEIRERDKKQKKAAIIRICIGVGFFIVLIIGLLRRRTKPSSPKGV